MGKLPVTEGIKIKRWGDVKRAAGDFDNRFVGQPTGLPNESQNSRTNPKKGFHLTNGRRRLRKREGGISTQG